MSDWRSSSFRSSKSRRMSSCVSAGMSHPVAEARVDEDISTSERSGGMRQEVQSKRSQCGTERGLIERRDSPDPWGHRNPTLRARSLNHRRDIVSEKRWKVYLWCKIGRAHV